MAKPLLDFKKMRELNFRQLARQVLINMRENKDLFPDCDPPIEQLEETFSRLAQADVEAAYHDILKVEIKNKLSEQMKQELHLLSLYVSRVANGDRGVILSSGFDCSKEYSLIGIAPKPNNLRVTPQINNPGVVKFKVDVWKKATAYLFEYRKVGDVNWTQVISTKSSLLCMGLESGVRYEVRVAYLTTNPKRVYSDVIEFYVF